MNRLQKLNRIMQELEHNGDVSEMEYATYKKLLDVVDACRAKIGETGDQRSEACGQTGAGEVNTEHPTLSGPC